jgi:hypothetical protein
LGFWKAPPGRFYLRFYPISVCGIPAQLSTQRRRPLSANRRAAPGSREQPFAHLKVGAGLDTLSGFKGALEGMSGRYGQNYRTEAADMELLTTRNQWLQRMKWKALTR